ncbi:MAG: hypothetical protein MUP11_06225 [Anaerolineales bacterium]|nr:hypothetical protein [Anaerolineales bacterium]
MQDYLSKKLMIRNISKFGAADTIWMGSFNLNALNSSIVRKNSFDQLTVNWMCKDNRVSRKEVSENGKTFEDNNKIAR